MPDPLREAAAHPAITHVDRRRLLGALAGGTFLAGVRSTTTLAQQATPSADHLLQLKALSRSLCGGGVLDEQRLTQLATLLASDPTLSAGLEELLRNDSATPSPAARSTEARAAAQEILLYWYIGEFKGKPVPDHAEEFTELQAWQAMYTSAWTTCKVYGAWADPPTMIPQEPENT